MVVAEGSHLTVSYRRDLTAQGLHDFLQFMSKSQLLQNQLLLIIMISAHGNEGTIAGVDQNPVQIRDIVGYFSDINCPTMAGKVKLFIFQACRGGLQETYFFSDPIIEQPMRDFEPASNSDLSEVVLAFGSRNKYVSYRDEEEGSYFPTTLWDIYQEMDESTDLIEFLDMTRNRLKHTPIPTLDRFNRIIYRRQTPSILTINFHQKVYLKQI
jgi:hypothetical protein